LENLRWIAAAALSALACHVAVHHATPIDRALPFLAVVVTFLARRSYSALMLAVPLLILTQILFPEESTRLLALGVVVAAAFAIALAGGGREIAPHPNPLPTAMKPPRGEGTRERDGSREDQISRAFSQRARWAKAHRSTGVMIGIAVAALLVLRWIPFSNVQLGRELFLFAFAAATVAVLGGTPFAVVVAVITALATPAVPQRTLILPLAVLFVAALARLFGMPRIRLTWLSTIVLAFVMLFFAWSGIVARAFPYFLRRATPPVPRTIIAEALPPNRTITYDVPDGARAIILSGANVARFRRGALMGRIEPGGIVVRIGDVADWGYMRRDHFYGAHNPLPREAAGKIREYGYMAWLDGAGRVLLPRGVRRIRVTAAATLPADASLQVEGFE
jgi:hypothetical protein